MKWRDKMPQKLPKALMECFETLEKIYDVVRIVDPVNNKVIYYKKDRQHVSLDEAACYGFWQKDKFCNNCISLRAFLKQETFVKFEVVNNRIYMITASPVQCSNGPCVVEMLNDITDKSVLESIVGTNQEDFSDVILRFNDTFVKDDLTKLFNRRFINERLPVEIATNIAASSPSCLVILDIDDFKFINDNYGHIAGDVILQQFSALLKNDVEGRTNWVARFGGDEFIIYLHNTNCEQAIKITEKIRYDVEHFSFSTKGLDFNITCSVGIGALESGMDMESWINVADQNLYVAKSQGGNKVICGAKK